MMLHSNIHLIILLILCITTLSNSWKLSLSDGTLHNSTRIKRQVQSCVLPNHPSNGRYTLIGSRESYTPNSIVNEYSSIQLTCTPPYVTKNVNPQTLCIGGLWSPPLSLVEECVRSTAVAPTNTAAGTATGVQLSNSGSTCVLPNHPQNGIFSVADSSGPYRANTTAPEFSSLRLRCSNNYVIKGSNPQSLCIEGAWSPLVSSLGVCVQMVQSNGASETDCALPRHPFNGEYRIIGSEDKLYVPDTFVSEHSSIDLICGASYTTQNKIARALCYNGDWYPTISELGGCVKKGALTTPTQTTTKEGTCTLPDHPANGRFQILGTGNFDYRPGSAVQQFTNILLTCTDNGGKNESTICYEGKWTPTIANLGVCTRNRVSTVTESSGSRHGCILPSSQSHGMYKMGNDKNYDLIILTCNNGYYPSYQSHICNNGIWYPSLFECIRTCPPLPKSESYTLICTRNRSYIDCLSDALEGTEVDVRCNTFFEYKSIRPIPKCQNGFWTNTIEPCTPGQVLECGKRRIPVQELIIGGNYSEKGEFPWLVGIYLANRSHICGGSIISRLYVLSAAHCFTIYNNSIQAVNPVDESNYLVAAGKHYRDLHSPLDDHSQITGIERIFIPSLYLGIVQLFRQDYAILQVKIPFQLSEYVQLVCIDWESKYLRQDFKENNTALVSGWGYTLEASDPSEELKKLQVHFKSRPTCSEILPREFALRYFTEEKLCAGYIGHTVCQGDSGGGLYFEHEGIHYVRGIVSVSPVSKVGCSANHYALYTDVAKYVDVISKETRRVL